MFKFVLSACAAFAFAAPTWQIIDSNLANTATGIAFTSDTVGYACGGSNGAGPQIFKSTDGGHDWTTCAATFGLDLLLLDLDATENVCS
jgi:photosystem II stability/assembly factor-like uncharacterized protein